MLFLTACQAPPATATRIERLAPPAALLECKGAPQVPPRPRTQRDVALYIAQLAAAHDDCEGNLAAVRAWAAGRP